ncbi:hypothetical protein IT408_04715 [Candidatus Uhrbacteria bacterium]|nr:hypothetical protein [Candidatus Uhrbacteria bacterium]
MSNESPMNFTSFEKKSGFSNPESLNDFQPVSSSGLEDLATDEEIEYVPVQESDDEAIPDTERDSTSGPHTQWSKDSASGVRIKMNEENVSQESDRISHDDRVTESPVAFEMTVTGAIKTEGDRTMPPYVASSLEPDQEEGDGREVA